MLLRGIACLCVLAGVAGASPRMFKGPYLQDVAPNAITIMWQAEPVQPARIVVTGPGGSERVIEVPAERITEARIEDLEPGTRYRYRVELGGESWDGELRTAPPEGKDVPFSFVVVGDSRSGLDQHRRVVERMSQEVPDFMLGTGDIVDEGHRLDQWQQFFEIEGELLRNNVFYPALGNHDRQGRGRTADNYRAFFSLPDNGDGERYYAFTYANARFVVLDSNAYSFALTDQTAWLERELVAARQDPAMRHVFVVMHHPPFSIALHGGATDLRERWTPLFEKYQVTAVFSGHDHVYSRAEHEGIRYFVTGGGGAPLYARRPRPDPVDAAAVKKFERVLHYLRVTVTSGRVEVTAVRADGTTIETTAWTDGRPGAPESEPAEPAPARVAMAGGPAPAVRAAHDGELPAEGRRTLWIGLVGLLVALGAAVAVVRTLR